MAKGDEKIRIYADIMSSKRNEKGWSRQDLASHIGIKASYIGSVERAEFFPRKSVMLLLADALDDTRLSNKELKEDLSALSEKRSRAAARKMILTTVIRNRRLVGRGI